MNNQEWVIWRISKSRGKEAIAVYKAFDGTPPDGQVQAYKDAYNAYLKTGDADPGISIVAEPKRVPTEQIQFIPAGQDRFRL